MTTRARAAQIRGAVEVLLVDAPTVVLDFTDMEAITGAAADELVAALVVAHPERIVCVGTNEYVQETIQIALRRRGVTAGRATT